MDRENFKHANSVGGVHKFSYVLHVGLELWCCEFSVAMRQMFGSNLNKFYVLLPLAQSSSRVLFTINVLQHRHGIGCYFLVKVLLISTVEQSTLKLLVKNINANFTVSKTRLWKDATPHSWWWRWWCFMTFPHKT
uniref:Uncharacterized protein n=1 Tax=Populus trichocarpa TaxID=3694 RepID=A0A2K2BSE4_POPTR